MATREEMLLAMGNASQMYARVEFNLFNLVAFLMGCKRESTAALFYSMTNSRDRNNAVKTLCRLHLEDERQPFVSSLMKHVQKIDEFRNKLAHGLVVMNADVLPPDHLIAKPVTYWIADWPGFEPVSIAQVGEHIERADNIRAILRNFTHFLAGGFDGEAGAKWDAVFKQPIELPLPVAHLIYDPTAALPD